MIILIWSKCLILREDGHLEGNTKMIDAIRPGFKPIRNPAHAIREAEQGWTTLVNLDRAFGVALNETGLFIWQRIDGRRTVAEIINEIKEYFPDAPPTVEEDSLALLEMLRQAGLIGFEVKI